MSYQEDVIEIPKCIDSSDYSTWSTSHAYTGQILEAHLNRFLYRVERRVVFHCTLQRENAIEKKDCLYCAK